MNKVYCDSLLLYDSRLESYQIFNPSVELELNKTGSFIFTVYPQHPHYSLIKKLKSIITVYQDDFLLFRGRVLDEDVGFYNQKTFICEGELSFLLDSIQKPFDFTGTVSEFLTMLISNHNAQVETAKRFTVGNITVAGGNITRTSTDHSNTWDAIQKNLLDSLGGFIGVRHEENTNYIDYLQTINVLAPQTIQFGKNLMDLKKARKGADIATVIIPLGAKLPDTDTRLTIAAVNGGRDFIEDQNAIAEFGRIVKTNVWDDVTDASDLMRKGQAFLADLVMGTESIELTAADLATADADFTSFHVGTMVQVSSSAHGINQRFLVTKLSINLLEPVANKLVLGSTQKGFSDDLKGISNGQGVILQEIQKVQKRASDAIIEAEQRLSSSIQQTETRITSTVAENYYLKGQTDALFQSVSTELEQTSEAFEFRFNTFDANIEAIATGTDAKFTEINRYIRFINGNIVLGQSGNELTLKIQNDRISFLDANHEVAYFSNQKLFVTDGEFLNSLRLGNFAFVPEQNGNLSFMKVV